MALPVLPYLISYYSSIISRQSVPINIPDSRPSTFYSTLISLPLVWSQHGQEEAYRLRQPIEGECKFLVSVLLALGIPLEAQVGK